MRAGFGPPGRSLALALAPLLLLSAAAFATDLRLIPQLEAQEDLARVAAREDGGIAVLSATGIDLVSPGGAAVPAVRGSDGEVLFLADAGGYVGVARFREGAADFAPAAAFALRDLAGRTFWSMGPTEDVTFAISSGGAVVGMSLNVNVPERNALHFYGAGGGLVAAVLVPFLTGGSFDPDGKVFFAMSSADGVRSFDRAGGELWRAGGGRMVAAIPGGGTVAIVGEQGLQVVRDGGLVATIPLDGILVRRLAIAPDGSRLALASRDEIRVYDARSLELAWSRRLESDAFAWTSVDLGASDGWLLAGLARDLGPGVSPERRHPDGEVRAYDAAGSLASSAPLEFPIWNIWTPTVRLDRTGGAATVITRRAVYRTVLR